jgi:CDP-diacylglycerol--glycerol-3-phosphate 3-phosphatidyltransferase
LGAALDTLYDALGLLIAPLVAVRFGKLHESYLLVSVAYYGFSLGIVWRRRHGLPVYPLAPSALRRTLAGCQMGFVALVLWPTLAASLTRWLGVYFMLPLLVGFLVDWWQVSGRYDPDDRRNVARRQRWLELLDFPVLPLLRFALMASLLLLPATWVLSWAAVVALAVAVGVGLLARLCSAALLILLAWNFPATSVDTLTLCCCAAAVTLLLFGGGRFTLWNADDRVLRRAGDDSGK